jgi:hypothetical protein
MIKIDQRLDFTKFSSKNLNAFPGYRMRMIASSVTSSHFVKKSKSFRED